MEEVKRLAQNADWPEMEKFILKKASKLLNVLSINTDKPNANVGEDVKARKLAAECVKEILAEIRRIGTPEKEIKIQSFH